MTTQAIAHIFIYIHTLFHKPKHTGLNKTMTVLLRPVVLVVMVRIIIRSDLQERSYKYGFVVISVCPAYTVTVLASHGKT